MHVVDHHSLGELESLYSQERDARHAMRLRCIILALRGQTAEQLSQWSGKTARTIQGWVMHYNRDGLSGLDDQVGRGAKPCLGPEEELRFRARIAAGAQGQDQVCVLRAIDVQRILEHEFGKVRKLAAVYKLLHKLGYTPLMPRPQHENSDPNAQAHFKKICRSNSPRFKRNIPHEDCNSSLKTRPALVSKEVSLASGH